MIPFRSRAGNIDNRHINKSNPQTPEWNITGTEDGRGTRLVFLTRNFNIFKEKGPLRRGLMVVPTSHKESPCYEAIVTITNSLLCSWSQLLTWKMGRIAPICGEASWGIRWEESCRQRMLNKPVSSTFPCMYQGTTTALRTPRDLAVLPLCSLPWQAICIFNSSKLLQTWFVLQMWLHVQNESLAGLVSTTLKEIRKYWAVFQKVENYLSIHK